MYYLVTRDNCSFCDKAKALLSAGEKPYFVINIQDYKYRFMANLLTMAGLTTVPQVWEDKTHIGGYTDLEEHLTKPKRFACSTNCSTDNPKNSLGS